MKSITTGWCRVGLLVLLLVNLSWAVELKGTVMALRGSDVKVDYVQEGKAATAQGDSKSLSPMKSLSTDQVGPNKSGKLKVRLLHHAADAGYTRAQFELAFAYANGLLRLKKDGRFAAKYYRLAADQGDASAQVELAGMHYKGWGVEKDLSLALRYFRLAADQGSRRGQYYLGHMYEIGRGVTKDKKEAINWYRKAAAQNYKPAIKDLKRLER
jgi:TPR repeat protein